MRRRMTKTKVKQEVLQQDNDRSTKQVLVLQYNRKHRKGNSGVHGCAANLASLGHQLKTGAKRIPQMVQKTFLKALDRDQDEKT
jgi:hypothetical protein